MVCCELAALMNWMGVLGQDICPGAWVVTQPHAQLKVAIGSWSIGNVGNRVPESLRTLLPPPPSATSCTKLNKEIQWPAIFQSNNAVIFRDHQHYPQHYFLNCPIKSIARDGKVLLLWWAVWGAPPRPGEVVDHPPVGHPCQDASLTSFLVLWPSKRG